MKPEPLSEPVHGVHPHPGGAAAGGSSPSSPTEKFKEGRAGSYPTPLLPGEPPHPRSGERAGEGEKEKMSPRRGPEKETALEAQLEDEWRLPSAESGCDAL